MLSITGLFRFDHAFRVVCYNLRVERVLSIKARHFNAGSRPGILNMVLAKFLRYPAGLPILLGAVFLTSCSFSGQPPLQSGGFQGTDRVTNLPSPSPTLPSTGPFGSTDSFTEAPPPPPTPAGLNPVSDSPTATPPPPPTLVLNSASSALTPTPPPFTTPASSALSRTPSLNELQSYLMAHAPGTWNYIEEVMHADVSGDGEQDLIAITDAEPVFIFIWQGGQYSPPNQTGSWKQGLSEADGRYVYLKDYTGDRVPEVVNDSWASRGSDEFTAIDWERQITFCKQDGCRVIWQDWTGTYADAPTSTGMFYYNSSDYAYRNDELQLILERRYFGFSIYWDYTGNLEPVLHPQYNAAQLGWDTSEKLYQDVEIIRRYVWNGEVYEFLEVELVTGPKLIDSDVRQRATGPHGVEARVRVEMDDTSPVYRNDRCEVYVSGESVSQPFGCKHNFTTVEWEDVAGDEEKEIIVKTISGDQSYIWNDLIAEKGCFHQRILVFRWDGETATQLANIVGCIRRSNLFGVRVTDYDNDGQLEILAATIWYQFLERNQPNGISQDYIQINQLVEIYEWDGQKFVIGSTLEIPGH